jgi:DivIVA domain-containing protein
MDQDDAEKRIAELERQLAERSRPVNSPAGGGLTAEQVHNVAFSKPPIGKRGYNEDGLTRFSTASRRRCEIRRGAPLPQSRFATWLSPSRPWECAAITKMRLMGFLNSLTRKSNPGRAGRRNPIFRRHPPAGRTHAILPPTPKAAGLSTL